ncbi:M48 family metallopeptidase [Chitinimonas sp.]|uniref:M48 metallopeptidase family protein n=1 Tax=Chitinimonas sp. TaxID=1934313 RepID=UPI002F9546BA
MTTPLKYLAAYSPALQEQVRGLIAQGRLGSHLGSRYPDGHAIQSDKALYQYVCERKDRYLRTAPAIDKVVYDSKLDVVHHALGLHTAISRVQGGKLKAKKEIRVATLFREAPEPFLQMIVVHELAHLKERDHNKAFYQLCCHMLADYHQLEFDLRLWLTLRELPEGS